MSGKGSKPRPLSVAQEEYNNRWDAIFGRDNEKKNEAQDLESDRPDHAQHSGGSDNPEGQAGQTKDA